MIYDLKKDVRYTLTQHCDRSVDELAVRPDIISSSGASAKRLAVLPGIYFLYLTAGDHARNKLVVIPIPDTPDESTMHPSFSTKYFTPQPLAHSGAVSALQILPNDKLLFSCSSLQGPNDVFVIRGLHELEAGFIKAQGDFIK